MDANSMISDPMMSLRTAMSDVGEWKAIFASSMQSTPDRQMTRARMDEVARMGAHNLMDDRM